MHYLHVQRLTPSEACSLLGICMFIAGQLQGRCLRLMDYALIQRQYHDRSSAMNPQIELALRFLLEVFFLSSPPSI